MIFDIAQLIVVLVSIFSFGYYRYLAGQYKGFLKAIEVYLKYEEKKMKMTPEQKAFYEYGRAVESLRGTIYKIRKMPFMDSGNHIAVS